MASQINLPAGFVLDEEEQTSNLPTGFVLDTVVGKPKIQEHMTFEGFKKNIIPSTIETAKGIATGIPAMAGKGIKAVADIGKAIITGDIKPVKKGIQETAEMAVGAAKEIPEKYGTPEKAIRTAYEKPAEVALDVFSILPSWKASQLMAKGYKAQQPIRMAELGSKLSKEATDMYRTMLRPFKGEISAIEIKGGKNIDDYYKLAAEENLPIKKTADNMLDTKDAVIKAREKLDTIQEELNSKLADNQTLFNLTEVRNKAAQKLRERFKNAKEYNDAVDDLDTYINSEIDRYGTNQLLAIEVNKIKQGMWGVGYNQMKPTAKSTARVIGNTIKEVLENKIDNVDVKTLNSASGEYATLINLLENAQGRPVVGGRLGGYFARGIGAIVGQSMGIPVVGPLVGQYGGKAIMEALTAPERISRIAGEKMAKAMKLNLAERLKKNKNIKPRINLNPVTEEGIAYGEYQ